MTSHSLSLLNTPAAVHQRANMGLITPAGPLAMTFSRTLLFAAYQALVALVFLIARRPDPWQAAIAWWPATVTIANLTCLGLLHRLAGREGLRLADLYNLDRRTVGRDLLVVLGLFVIGGPLGYLPGELLAQSLFGGSEAASYLWLLPLPVWAAVLFSVLFPLTVALSELPTYFGYALPRLQALWNRRWLPVLLTAFMLSAQHVAMPLIFDGRFVLWRLTMFLPFALFLGLVVNWRPRLLPYLMLVHGLMDISVVVYVLMRSLPGG